MYLYSFEIWCENEYRTVTVRANNESEAAAIVAANYDGGHFARLVEVEVEEEVAS